MAKWFNYFLQSKNSRLTQGHIPTDKLYEKILSHDGSEAYCCYFDLDYDSLKMEYWNGEYEPDGKKIYEYLPQKDTPTGDYYKPEMTFTQYEGNCKPSLNMVSFDFDSDDVQESLDDVKKFVEFLGVDDIAVFFSGAKGFHVMVPWGYFPLEANPHLPNQLKDGAKILAEDYPTLDTSIYNYNRKFRVPFTKHDKSGLFKTYLYGGMIFNNDIEQIKNYSEQIATHDFLADIKPNLPREPLPHLIELFESAKRKSYEIEKSKAGNKEKPSPFESYDGKKCIAKMLTSRCDDIGRNNACIRIVNDFYRTGKLQDDCEKEIYVWGVKVGLPANEISTIVTNIYNRNGNYNFGCQDEAKSTYCTAKCELWRKLAPDKRPVVADAPASESSSIKKDFDGVGWLMQNILAAYGMKN